MKTVTLQYTLFCTSGEYKPVSCLLEVDVKKYNQNPKLYQLKAIEKICIKRGWTGRDLEKYHYKKIKCRKYEKSLDK